MDYLDKNTQELFYSFSLQPKYESVTAEVMLEYIAKIPAGKALLNKSNANIEKMLSELEACNKSLLLPSHKLAESKQTNFSEEASYVLRSVVRSAEQNNKLVTLFDILVMLVKTEGLYASKILKDAGVSVRGLSGLNNNESKENESAHMTAENETIEEGDLLEKLTDNLNEKAKAGKFDKLIGRDKEVERTIQTLTRRRKNNPLLVGDPGVGKTAVVEGLALRIVEGEVPEQIKNAVIYSLNMGVLLAGTKYRGDMEKRLKSLVRQLEKDENAILFIDEIHTLVGAGAAGGMLDAANILKPALSSGAIRVIGATTHQEKRSGFDKDAALARRFQVVDVAEPTVEETIKILMSLKANYEKHHNVKYTDQAIEQAVLLSVRYLNERKLPDKAIDIMDEAGAFQNIIPGMNRQDIIKVRDIELIVASLAKLPPKQVEGNDKERMRNLVAELKKVVFGQEEAISTLEEAVLVSRAGIGENGKNKPMGSFLFTGPTGVGKTEVTKQLSQIMEMPLIRFDMSEYAEKHTISKLIGAPAGYVGHGEGGILTDAVYRQPNSIVLFDEIEKADPSIYNIMLQIMDHGFLTDSMGKKVNFRNTLVIFTTNTGAVSAQKNSIGFGKNLDSDSDENRSFEIERTFSPEFRGRLDKIVNFKPLNKEVAAMVVGKKLNDIAVDLKEKKIEVEFSDSVRNYLLEVGYSEKLGARPLVGKIKDLISVPLAREILFGKLQYGGKLLIDVEENKAVLNVLQSKRKPKKEELEEVVS